MISNNEKCVGCHACEATCSVGAISFKKRNDGFYYPLIDTSACVKCNLCETVCPILINNYHDEEQTAFALSPLTYNKNDLSLISTSGGAFYYIAIKFLKSGGIVYGCRLNGKMIEWVRVTNENDLSTIQGSKYIESSSVTYYKQIKKDLSNNLNILFAGLPCQVSGLRAFLGRDYSGLFTIDLICHGTPSSSFFSKYVESQEKKNNTNVVSIIFRDKKRRGWCLKGTIVQQKHNKTTTKQMSSSNSSYYHFFLNSNIYREECYCCKFANNKRVSDITLGDFWGIEKNKNFTTYKKHKKGVSLVICNTNKGLRYIEELKNPQILLCRIEDNSFLNYNKQLSFPSPIQKRKTTMLIDVEQKGYLIAEQTFKSRPLKTKIKTFVSNLLPLSFKDFIKKIL